MGFVEDAYRKLGQYVDPSHASGGGGGQGSSTSLAAPPCRCLHQPGCPAINSHAAAQQALYAPTPYAQGGNIQQQQQQQQHQYGDAAQIPSTTQPTLPPGAIAGPGGYFLPFDEYKRLLKDKKRMKQLKGTDYAPGAPLGLQGYFMTFKQDKKRREDKEEDEIWDAVLGM